MSLDVSLYIDGQCVFEANITHNLNAMALEAGIYQHLWRPEELKIKTAKDLIEPIEAGLSKIACNKSHYEQFNASNGWGLWEHFVPWIAAYLQACRDHPEATISISR